MSRYKGGTLIAEDVHDPATQYRCMADPDMCRPYECPRCHGRVLHVHDRLHRVPRGEPGWPPVIPILRFICASPSCRATWRILPAFLARHLWRVWPTVERTVKPCAPPPATAKPIPERTAQRWHERVASAARQLVVLLATRGGVLLEEIVKRAGLDATRMELVDVHAEVAATPPGRRLADLAALVHRLERGIRLM